MTRQVYNMVQLLKTQEESREEMEYAIAEFGKNLAEFKTRLEVVAELANLDNANELGQLFEKLAKQLCEARDTIWEIETVSGVQSTRMPTTSIKDDEQAPATLRTGHTSK